MKEIKLPDPTPEQREYLAKQLAAVDNYDPKTVIGGPKPMNNKKLIEELKKSALVHQGFDIPAGSIVDMLFAAATALEEFEWKDINTAPKTGEPILLKVGNIVGSGRFGKTFPWGKTMKDGFYFDGADNPSMAAEWMHLPHTKKGNMIK